MTVLRQLWDFAAKMDFKRMKEYELYLLAERYSNWEICAQRSIHLGPSQEFLMDKNNDILRKRLSALFRDFSSKIAIYCGNKQVVNSWNKCENKDSLSKIDDHN